MPWNDKDELTEAMNHAVTQGFRARMDIQSRMAIDSTKLNPYSTDPWIMLWDLGWDAAQQKMHMGKILEIAARAEDQAHEAAAIYDFHSYHCGAPVGRFSSVKRCRHCGSLVEVGNAKNS